MITWKGFFERLTTMADRRARTTDAVLNIVTAAGVAVVSYFFVRNLFASVLNNLGDPEKEKHEQARIRAEANLARLGRSRANGVDSGDYTDSARRGPRIEDMKLNEYESVVALEVVAPEDISVSFEDIGGLDDIIDEVKEAVIYPLTMPQLYSHAAPLLSAPSGVLLYGPPGCGKTMLAKAVAHESGAAFINLHISTLTEKWYGDSNKLVRAVFSLARKLEPAIIFIDEIDAVLGTRRSNEHEASGMVKAEFMTLWDGLTSSNSAGVPSRICVLGATNRINDIDEAILRRMPKKFAVPLPTSDQRRRILQLILHGTKRDVDFDLEYLAKVTAGMSGSDIKEACRDAAMVPMREYIRARKAAGQSMARVDPTRIRGLKTEDFFGRKGGDELLMQNHSNQSAKRVESSGDEYEDVPDSAAESQD
ncbi:ATPase family AAA domain-containing protein 1 [Coniella lustricola]|uniref:ATPase family AAA domain-containing protein 1 n=1 Tax=Coniella lustricola TaxID=2025994 RepID=A0A2T2ZVS8_9PEZI|nr:ATPase family AAA domain-containing protein 1 [Coniella lustricola]